MTEHQQAAAWNVSDWHGKMVVDCHGEKIGKLQDVSVDAAIRHGQRRTDRPALTFVPMGGTTVGPDELKVVVSRDLVKSAPSIEQHGEELSQAGESALYHHFELNYTPPNTESGRRLARR